MYITYHETFLQTERDNNGKHVKRRDPRYAFPDVLPKPKVMPDYLIRVPGMKLVRGANVHNGYCALSYSWNQTGDIKSGEIIGRQAMRVDKGKHKIIRSKDQLQTDNDKDDILDRVVEVPFAGIIQQICRDLNIKYIWYDQHCYEESHLSDFSTTANSAYRYAHCTIAFVPELHKPPSLLTKTTRNDIYDAGAIISRSEWQKRLWTLIEAIISNKLLFVGKDVHQWGNEVGCSYGVNVLNLPLSELSLKEILYHMHQRTSLISYDRVQALTGLYHNLKKEVESHFGRDASKDISTIPATIMSYCALAKKDISILCFNKRNDDYESKMQEFEKIMPSWAGIQGQHNPDVNITNTPLFRDYVFIGKTMHLTSSYVTNHHHQDINGNAFILKKEDLPAISDNNNEDNNNYCLGISVRLPGTNKFKIISVLKVDDNSVSDGYELYLCQITRKLQQLSRFMEVKKENLCWYNTKSTNHSSIDFDILTENLDDLSVQVHYAILFGIQFKKQDNNDFAYYPVIKKSEGVQSCKSIGTCRIDNPDYLISDCNFPKKKFFLG